MTTDITVLQEKMRKAGKDGVIKILFVGNSATYVHELPQTLCRLAGEAGYYIEANSIVKGGYELAQHVDVTTSHGQNVLDEIAKGYNVVFLQDNGSCVTTEEKSQAARCACEALNRAIVAAGGKTYLYVRPPYGYDHAGRTPFEQCIAFDVLFNEIAEQIDAVNAYVNRAFAYAMTHLDCDLWGPDHAHTSEFGGYLAVCVFFATLFGISATVLGANSLPQKDALALQKVADMIVIDRMIPWNGEEC